MKLVNMETEAGARLGVLVDDGRVMDVAETARLQKAWAPATMEEAIEAGERGLDGLRELAKGELVEVPLAELRYAPVVTDPQKILCVGLNYKKHGIEFKAELPTEPLLFGKYNNALAGNEATVTLGPVSEQYDYEVELVMVVGRRAKDVAPEDALDYVFGYTVGNDLTARDLQNRTGQWLIGKNLDSFGPTGPVVVTADALDPSDLHISLTKNGVTEQDAHTSSMIFDCAQVLSTASRYMTLEPGDLIFTGTPAGVVYGKPEGQQDWIRPGDVVEASIEGIGTLVTRFA